MHTDPQAYELMEWLEKNPSARRGDMPEALAPWMPVLRENWWLKDDGTMHDYPSLSDVGKIALLKHRLKAAQTSQGSQSNGANDDYPPEVYAAMEWLKKNPHAYRDHMPKELECFMYVLKGRYVKGDGTMLTCPTLSDSGQIALSEYQRRTKAGQVVEPKGPAPASQEQASLLEPASPVIRPPRVVAASRKSNRGRKPDTDAKADRRIAEAWDSGHYPTYEDLANELGMDKRDIERALDRHRKRSK
jgi:hypothetical protein